MFGRCRTSGTDVNAIVNAIDRPLTTALLVAHNGSACGSQRLCLWLATARLVARNGSACGSQRLCLWLATARLVARTHARTCARCLWLGLWLHCMNSASCLPSSCTRPPLPVTPRRHPIRAKSSNVLIVAGTKNSHVLILAGQKIAMYSSWLAPKIAMYSSWPAKK